MQALFSETFHETLQGRDRAMYSNYIPPYIERARGYPRHILYSPAGFLLTLANKMCIQHSSLIELHMAMNLQTVVCDDITVSCVLIR